MGSAIFQRRERRTPALAPLRSFLMHLECSRAGKRYDADVPQNLLEIGAPLLARCDLARAAVVTPESLKASDLPGLWRYAPLIDVPRLGRVLGLENLMVKEESVNPTGTFKARGRAVAVAHAHELGSAELAIGTADSAGRAFAVCAAASGLAGHVATPCDTPRVIAAECAAFGATLTLVEGLITDANALAQQGAATYAARKKLVAGGWVGRDERVVLFDTGSGVKYLKAWTGETPSNA